MTKAVVVEINAVGLDLKFHSPGIDSVLPVSTHALPAPTFARDEPWPAQERRTALGVGARLKPLPQPCSESLDHSNLGSLRSLDAAQKLGRAGTGRWAIQS